MPKTAKIDKPKGKVHKDKTAPPPPAGASEATASSNGPDRDEILFMRGRFNAQKVKLKAEQQAWKKLRSVAKLRGFNLQQFDAAIAESELDDGTTLFNMKDFKTYCEAFDLPISYQFKLFDDPTDKAAFSEEYKLKRAYQDGYQDGLMGKDQDQQKYLPITAEGQEYLRGWNDGQAVLLAKIGKLEIEIKSSDKPKRKGRKAAEEPDDDGDGDDSVDETEMDEAA